jgi:hypothetical protein
LRTHPITPSLRARRSVDSRNPTPCTAPRTTARNAFFSVPARLLTRPILTGRDKRGSPDTRVSAEDVEDLIALPARGAAESRVRRRPRYGSWLREPGAFTKATEQLPAPTRPRSIAEAD